jgi:hypothetical protein
MQDFRHLKSLFARHSCAGRDFNAADNFTLGAGIVRYGSTRSEHVQDLILFLAKLNMAETCDSLFLKRLVLVV